MQFPGGGGVWVSHRIPKQFLYYSRIRPRLIGCLSDRRVMQLPARPIKICFAQHVTLNISITKYIALYFGWIWWCGWDEQIKLCKSLNTCPGIRASSYMPAQLAGHYHNYWCCCCSIADFSTLYRLHHCIIKSIKSVSVYGHSLMLWTDTSNIFIYLHWTTTNINPK